MSSGEKCDDLSGGDGRLALNALAHGEIADEPRDGCHDGETVDLEGDKFHPLWMEG